jgi:2-keto-4-pentenoate hydratase/2-oxohepta-3-ene-1,7-dioic acid hydratase in catechol pathway
MRLVSCTFNSRASAGLVDGDHVIPLARREGTPYRTVDELLEGGDLTATVEEAVRGARLSRNAVTLRPPVIDPGKIICVGVNYRTHLDETGRPQAQHPTLFTRFSDTQIADGEPLVIPTASNTLDYEGELAVVIGANAYRLSEQDAWGVIAGYAVYNDGSVREWQRHSSQWIPGKNFAGTGVLGPALVTPDEVGDVDELELETTVNGDLRQSAPVADLIFKIPQLIAYISTFTTLAPGDIVVTGTPGGVGLFREPPEYLKAGDLVEVSISRVGVIRNKVVAEADTVVADRP